MLRFDGFSTKLFPPEARLRVWTELLRPTFGDVYVTPSAREDIDVWADSVRDGRVVLCRIGASAQRVERRNGTPNVQDSDVIHAIFPLLGRFHVEQEGHGVVLAPGDWGLYDPAAPFRTENDGPIEMLVLGAPRSALLGRGMGSPRLDARRFPIGNGSARIAKSYLAWLISERHALSASMSTELAATAVQLVRLSLADCLRVHTELDSREALRVRIRGYIDQNLHNADLSVAGIAAAHNCSKRYLHKVFSGGCETLSQYILRARLEHCRQDLERPEFAHLSVTQIAFSWGFNSQGHFSHAFRKHFDVSPSTLRLPRTARIGIRRASAPTSSERSPPSVHHAERSFSRSPRHMSSTPGGSDAA